MVRRAYSVMAGVMCDPGDCTPEFLNWIFSQTLLSSDVILTGFVVGVLVYVVWSLADR